MARKSNKSFPYPEFNSDKVRNRGVAETQANAAKHEARIASLDKQHPVEKGGRGDAK